MVTLVVSTLMTVVAVTPASSQASSNELAELVASFLAWRPSPGAADEVNPYRPKLLAQGDAGVQPLLTALTKAPDDVAAVWLLGEIGSSKGFPWLLSRYLAAPSQRVAISIGSCLGVAEVDYLFATEVLDETSRRALLADIYGVRWSELKNDSLESIRKHLEKHLEEVRTMNRKRSQPSIG